MRQYLQKQRTPKELLPQRIQGKRNAPAPAEAETGASRAVLPAYRDPTGKRPRSYLTDRYVGCVSTRPSDSSTLPTAGTCCSRKRAKA